ncbi:DNA methyltransferase [Cryptosporangium sp. NPDC048952]|uniref:DNA methyltransferase n=1 Tax=Cryptosporangium sp. NPDC048952 TaxID=3363961 RepID=UPI0037240C59
MRDPIARRAFGEHYTPEPIVLRTLGPLFLDSLRASGDLDAIAAVRFLDPACGSGNFLVVAYRELRRLEMDAIALLRAAVEPTAARPATAGAAVAIAGAAVGGASAAADFVAGWWDAELWPRVRLENFYGIEVDAGAARVASEALRIVERECNREFSERFGVEVPPGPPATIVVGNALTLDWASVCEPSSSVIVAGNPPYLGPKERSSSQTADLRTVWGPRYSGLLDYVSGWFAKAAAYCEGDWAFVATNSIVHGQGVPTLFGAVFDAGWRIKFAHRPFTWPAAAVHCVIVGFTRSSPPTSINAYLVDGPDVLVTPRRTPLAPDLPPVTAGSKAVDWGYLTVSPSDYAEVAADPIASSYLRPYYGGEELINALDRWCLWFEGASLSSLYASPLLAARLEAVHALRLSSPKPATRAAAATPHLFHERRQPTVPYLGIPQTFTDNRSYATAGYLSSDVIASIKLFTAPDPDGFLFALISSAAFLTWQRTVGGRIKSDPSFTNTVVWNTLPLARVSPDARLRVAQAGRNVLVARNPSASLAAQYSQNTMPSALVSSHREIDAVVDALFGMHEGSRQEVLLKRYAELTAPLAV